MVSRTEHSFEKALLNAAPASDAGYSSSGDRQTRKEHHSLQIAGKQLMPAVAH